MGTALSCNRCTGNQLSDAARTNYQLAQRTPPTIIRWQDYNRPPRHQAREQCVQLLKNDWIYTEESHSPPDAKWIGETGGLWPQ